MKKLLYLLLISVMVLSLVFTFASCDENGNLNIGQILNGGNDENPDNTDDTPGDDTGDKPGDDSGEKPDDKPTDSHTHDYSEEVASDKYLKSSATCTSAAEYYYSCECGEADTESFTYGEAMGHTWQKAGCTTPETCRNCSATRGTANGHSYADGYCVNCGELDPDFTPGCEHVWVDPTCTEDGYCELCKALGESAKGHSYSDGYCVNCGEPDPDFVPECEHVWTDPTCTEDGYCELCEEPGESAKGHSYSDGYCVNCGEADPDYTPDDVECKHNYEMKVEDATCITEGIIYYTCTECGDRYYENTGLGDHELDDAGYCIHCSGYFGEVVDPDYCYHENRTEATCTEDSVCYACGTILVAAYGHQYIDGSCVNCGDPDPDYSTECEHVWADPTCTEDGYCELCKIIGEYAYGHDYNSEGYCNRCSESNPDYYPEYVYFLIYLFEYYTYDESGYYEATVNYDKGDMYTGGITEKRNTLANLLSERYGTTLGESNYVWYANGEELTEDYLIRVDDKLVAIQKGHPEDFSSTVTISIPSLGIEEVHSFPCPVSYYELVDEFYVKHAIDSNIYTIVDNNSTIDSLAYGEINVSYIECQKHASAYLVTDSGTKMLASEVYSATQFPSVAEFLGGIGINVDDYVIFNYGSVIEDLNTTSYSTLFLIEKSEVEEEITVNVIYVMDEYTTLEGTITLTSPTSIEYFAYQDVYTEDEGYFSLPGYSPEYLYRVGNTDYHPELESWYGFIYKDCTVEIIPCYVAYVELYDSITGNYIYEALVFDSVPNGAQIAEFIDADLTMYTINVEGMQYDYDTFVGTCFEFRAFSVFFTPNQVRVTVSVFDENGYEYTEEFTGDICFDLAQFGYPTEGVYVWTLYYPDGSCEEIESLDITLYYDPAFSETDYDRSYTSYKIIGICQTFRMSVSTENYYGEKFVNKNDGLTVGEILTIYFGLEFDNYDWNYNSYEYIDGFSKDYVPYASLELWGTDNRPCVAVHTNGNDYKIYHTANLTLAEVIALVNEEHGLELDLDGYTWNVDGSTVTDPDAEVATEGNSCYIYVSAFNEVKVFFYTEVGLVGDYESPYVYTRDGEWSTPELDSQYTDFTYGIMYFSGEWEYRSEDGAITINSVEDLFALKLTAVSLNAKFEVDFDRLCGLYLTDNQVIRIDENTLSFYNIYSGGLFEKHTDLEYEVSLSGMSFAINAGDFCFEGMWFQECYKMTAEDIRIVVLDPWGSISTCYTVEDYNEYVQSYNVDSVNDYDGNPTEEFTYGNVYFVYTSEIVE